MPAHAVCCLYDCLCLQPDHLVLGAHQTAAGQGWSGLALLPARLGLAPAVGRGRSGAACSSPGQHGQSQRGGGACGSRGTSARCSFAQPQQFGRAAAASWRAVCTSFSFGSSCKSGFATPGDFLCVSGCVKLLYSDVHRHSEQTTAL